LIVLDEGHFFKFKIQSIIQTIVVFLHKTIGIVMNIKNNTSDSGIKIAVFSSDAGIGAWYLLQYCDAQKKLGQPVPFEIVYFFSDKDSANGASRIKIMPNIYYALLDPVYATQDVRPLLRERHIAVECLDMDDFYKQRGFQSKHSAPLINEKNCAIRREYYELVNSKLKEFEMRSGSKIDLIVLDNYMSIITEPIFQWPIINCHCADLRKLNDQGERVYAGYHPVLSALANQEPHLYATTHFVDQFVDNGSIIEVSEPFPVDFKRDQAFIAFDAPTDKEGCFNYFSNMDNYPTLLTKIEDLYEAYLKLYVQNKLLNSTLISIATNTRSP